VKQLLLRALERMGYVVIHASAWRELQNQLTACRSEGHTLDACVANRSFRGQGSRPYADRDRLQTDLTACRGQLARADTAGRVHDLENDTQRLRQRIADLEVFLQETQKMRSS